MMALSSSKAATATILLCACNVTQMDWLGAPAITQLKRSDVYPFLTDICEKSFSAVSNFNSSLSIMVAKLIMIFDSPILYFYVLNPGITAFLSVNLFPRQIPVSFDLHNAKC